MIPPRLAAALADRYRIERELGQGGMATVYLAQDLKHDRKVALKVLKPELAAVLGAERFVVEIKTTAALQHPHILPLFDSGRTGGQADGRSDDFLYYVMPYVQGETLRDKLNRETQLGIEEAVRITREVADALDYAHRHGVIHRDIKPENILLHDGRPMVADFGIALAVSAAAGGRMTETGLSLGTPHYMSPEQATAEKELSNRSDIYSLGCVLYEMLSGSPPHTGATAQQIVMKILTDDARPVTELRRSVPPNVAAALAKAVEKLPADRFESARAFAEALANPGFAVAGRAVHPAAAAAVSSRWRTRFFALAAATGVLLAITLLAWRAGWFGPSEPAEVSRFALELPSIANVGLDRSALRMALSRDGRKFVFVGAAGNTSQLYLRRLDQLTLQPIPGTLGAVNPAFSPDGNKIAFVTSSPRALKIVSLAGGTSQLLTDSLVDFGGVSWGSDGYIYYDGHLEGDGLARIRETGGKPEIASRPVDASESWHASPAALPNGRGVLFSVARGRGANPFDIAVLDTRTGKHHILVRGVAARYAASGHLLFASEEGSLMAIRFDPDRLTTSGEAVSLAEGLAVRGLGRSDLASSDGGMLAYITGMIGGLNRELVWVTREGRETRVDSAWALPVLSRPALSPPDGKQVVLGVSNGSRTEIWVKRLDRGPASKLSESGVAPGWTPDGREVVFYGSGGIYRGPADGSVSPALRYPRRDIWINLEFSPNGQWLIGTMGGDIVGIHTTGDTALVPLVGGLRLQRRGTISPDGRWLAYESEEDGTMQVYVRPFPGTQAAKHQISVSGGQLPRWSPDGRELFFVNDASELIAVPVTLAPSFSSGLPRVLFKAGPIALPLLSFDVHPDGKRFLFARLVQRGAGIPDQLVVVENFFTELRARLP